MYTPENYGNTVRILAAMAEYVNHIEDSLHLDNVMALELLNEPWAHLVRAEHRRGGERREEHGISLSHNWRIIHAAVTNLSGFVEDTPRLRQGGG